MSATPGSPSWRRDQAERLLGFAAGSRTAAGFGYLDERGAVGSSARRELWINARMTYVFATAARHGLGAGLDVAGLARHGVLALTGLFADAEHGGWVREVEVDADATSSAEPVDDTKACYEHAFVLLAGCAAADAGVEGGTMLRDEAARVHLERFWDDEAGRCREEWSRDFSELDGYRGANSNMHTVEAYLAAAASTGDDAWRRRAGRIGAAFVDVARGHDGRLVEHFDEHWHPLPEHHRDRPDDRFRPYGSTPGHGFEWARLLTDLGLIDDARSLFERAAADTGDGARGFGYTVDWQGRPVVESRFHWVLAEALLAADALAAVLPDEPRYPALRDAWWELADRSYVDHEHGSWHHELSVGLEPAATTWRGKPDAYHAFNALTASRPSLLG